MEEETNTAVVQGKRRRSSILKIQVNEVKSEVTSTTVGAKRMSRRVSFADIRIVKEFDKDLGIDHPAQEELVVHNSESQGMDDDGLDRELIISVPQSNDPPPVPISQSPVKPVTFNLDELSPRVKAFYNVQETVDYETLLNTSANQTLGVRDPEEVVAVEAHKDWGIPLLQLQSEGTSQDSLIDEVFGSASMDITDDGYSVNIRQLLNASRPNLNAAELDEMEITSEDPTVEVIAEAAATAAILPIQDRLDGNSKLKGNSGEKSGMSSFMGVSGNCTRHLLDLLQPGDDNCQDEPREDLSRQHLNIFNLSGVSDSDQSATGDILNVLKETRVVSVNPIQGITTDSPSIAAVVTPTTAAGSKSAMSLVTPTMPVEVFVERPNINCCLQAESTDVGVTDITDLEMVDPDYSLIDASAAVDIPSGVSMETVEMLTSSANKTIESSTAPPIVMMAAQSTSLKSVVKTIPMPSLSELNAEISLTKGAATLGSNARNTMYLSQLEEKLNGVSTDFFGTLETDANRHVEDVMSMQLEQIRQRFQLKSNEEAQQFVADLWRTCQAKVIADFCDAKTEVLREVAETLKIATKNDEVIEQSRKKDEGLLAQFAGHTNESLAEEEAQLKKSIEVCRTAAASIPDALKANAAYAKAKSDAKALKEAIRKKKLDKIDLATAMVRERLEKLRKDKQQQQQETSASKLD